MKYLLASWMMLMAACGGSAGHPSPSPDGSMQMTAGDMSQATLGICASFCQKVVMCGTSTALECSYDCSFDGGIPDLGDACDQSNLACQLRCGMTATCANLTSCLDSCPTCP